MSLREDVVHCICLRFCFAVWLRVRFVCFLSDISASNSVFNAVGGAGAHVFAPAQAMRLAAAIGAARPIAQTKCSPNFLSGFVVDLGFFAAREKTVSESSFCGRIALSSLKCSRLQMVRYCS